VPVVVGTAVGWWARTGAPAGVKLVGGPGHVVWWRAACALVVSLAIQVGTNYANDYSDGVRGTDAVRVGPLRLVASGAAKPATVRAAALGAFAIAAAAGVALAAATSWWLLAVGAACFAAGWLYTGGPKPYGYMGLGEPFVFVFFGLVATAGSAYVQSGRFSLWWAAVPVGLVSVALLEANNLRDIPGDVLAAKRTLAVRLGPRRARWLYVGALAAAAAGVCAVGAVRPLAFLGLLALVPAVAPCRAVLAGAEGRALLPVLGATGRIQMALGALLALGILL
jgi:1,4-dihydroxy-2-naphthoate octaprenyltransferase